VRRKPVRSGPECLGAGGCASGDYTHATPFKNESGTGPGAVIPAGRLNKTALDMLNLWPAPTNTSAVLNNYVAGYALGGNQNQNVVRVDQKINDKQNLFGRFSQWNNLNQPEDPLGTGLCLDRCTETMTSKAIALGYNYIFTPM